jgi:SagB-type dehydrogenase family enzyme
MALANDPALRRSARRSSKRLPHLRSTSLPEPQLPTMSLGDALRRRRSVRDFAPEPLRLDELSTLLYAAYGITGAMAGGDPDDDVQQLRTCPSGGALFPLELAVLANDVDGLSEGLHHYAPFEHLLEEFGPVDEEAFTAAMVDRDYAEAPAVVLVSAVFWRSRFKYGQRGYRFALLEAGHLAQNLLLTATALGLGAFPIGGFYDRRLDDLLGLDGVNESSLYAVPVGRGAPA